MDNVALARRAWAHAEKGTAERRAADYKAFLELLADDVVWEFACPEDTPGHGTLRGKPAVIDYLESVVPQLFEDAWLERPIEFLGNGDRVVALGAESYTMKKSGITIRGKEFALVNDFRDGRIIRLLWIGDMSEVVAACPIEGSM